jgi:hypothetical protein
MGCSVEVVEMAPTALQPGFSFAVAFEALHSSLALELRTKCSTRMAVEEAEVAQEFTEGEGDERCFALRKQFHEVERWRGSVGAMLCGYERRKSEEFARLREESESQALLAQRHAEQQVECLQKLHTAEVHELYDVFMQVQQPQPITEEFLASIQTRTSLQLREVVETQQQQIQELHASNFLSHLKEQSLEEETTLLKLALLEKDDILASLKTEVEMLIPKLHGYIDAREHLLTMTLKEKTRDDLQKLELLLRNEQRENAWMQRALKENKRKRADRLSRLQKQVADLTATVAQKDDVIGMLERGFRLGNLKETFPQWQPETTTIC